jgi:dihydroorotate dehydrogenase electron transfer subunit
MRISGTVYKYTFQAPDIAASALPGQFVQIKVSEDYFPLWPRPFSIYDVDGREGNFEIIFKVFGRGTSRLARLCEGDNVHILGPLGNGFAPLSEKGHVIMAAGGVGMPPLYFLAKTSVTDGFSPGRITFISGARTKEDLFDDGGLSKLDLDSRICTDDASFGSPGTVVDLLETELKKVSPDAVYSCGPSAMLEKIDHILRRRKIRGYLSLEALMPCGIGICSGCAVRTTPDVDRGPTDDGRDYHLRRVCREGPVFESGRVIWE